MPRKSRKSGAATLGINPRENLLNHRNFLARSLSRNDNELAALAKLNISLREAKEAVVTNCGESVLIDLGVGKLKLINDELHQVAADGGEEQSQVHRLSPAQTGLCVNFLLRMKLRRNLCNRLSRRLNRIAHAMDGEDIAPPPPPRYGDLSLRIDPEALKVKEAQWERLKEAKARLELAKTSNPDKVTSSALPAMQEITEAEREPSDVPSIDAAAVPNAPKQETETKESTEGNADADHAELDTKTKMEESPPDNPDSVSPLNSSVTPVKKQETVSLTQKEQDQELLKTYDAAYEKIWDSATKKFKFSILEENREPDYAATQGVRVGALSRHMTVEERQEENKRWQSSVLARIPLQPNFADFGPKNNVYCFEQRLKRCREEADQEAQAELGCKKPKHEDDGDDMDVDEPVEGKDEEEKPISEEAQKAEEIDAPEIEKDGDPEATENELTLEPKKDISLEPKKDISLEPKKADVAEEVAEDFKPARSMSLAAVPSFHDQDINRLKMIQAEMIGQSIISTARARMTGLVHAYNDALIKSVACNNRRQQIHNQMAISLDQGRREITKANSEYALKLTLCKQKWFAEKQEHDTKRLTTMPSRFGQLPQGTVSIQKYLRNPNKPNSFVVGTCMGDIVDLTVFQAEGKLASNIKFPDFVPPPAPVVPQQRLQEQANLKKEFAIVSTQLSRLEEARKLKWRKYMNCRAEFELKHGMGNRRTAATYTNNPCAPLNRATQQAVPNLQFLVAARAGYTPSNYIPSNYTPSNYTPPSDYTPSNRPPSSDPKYSAAQVRQRISNDGTVAPVSEPKKTKDGLYMRPSGRTRKGMQWDAIRGLWVPKN